MNIYTIKQDFIKCNLSALALYAVEKIPTKIGAWVWTAHPELAMQFSEESLRKLLFSTDFGRPKSGPSSIAGPTQKREAENEVSPAAKRAKLTRIDPDWIPGKRITRSSKKTISSDSEESDSEESDSEESDEVKKKVPTKITNTDMQYLENIFTKDQNPNREKRRKIEFHLELSYTQVYQWFYNRRKQNEANKDIENDNPKHKTVGIAKGDLSVEKIIKMQENITKIHDMVRNSQK